MISSNTELHVATMLTFSYSIYLLKHRFINLVNDKIVLLFRFAALDAGDIAVLKTYVSTIYFRK